MHVFKVTKFDPEHFGARGYFGSEDIRSDHGPLEAAYLTAVQAFAEDTGVTELTIREPSVGGPINFGLEPHVEGHGLTGLFPPDLSGYHDGAQVPLATGVALVKAMLRNNGAWCRLEVDGRFFVHVGYDQYMYIGSAEPCDDAADRVRALGLFPEPLRRSPWDLDADELDSPRPAGEAFWAELAELAANRGSVIFQENFVGNASRWRRLRAADVPAAREGLTPRAHLAVWPELNPDVAAELRRVEDRGLCTVVWENADGVITGLWAVDDDLPALTARLAGARGATVISADPLLSAVLPDDDGVVRVRWSK